MSNIKIFVSHRIDYECKTFNNPLYIPVLCGAIYNTRPTNLIGDNTGDNISGKRNLYGELTVQYWVWKNIQADYYGLHHYRRYLSFSPKRFRTNTHNHVFSSQVSNINAYRFGLDNPEKMERIINSFDAIVPEAADVNKIPTPRGSQDTVYKLWESHDGIFVKKELLDLLVRVIDQRWSAYSSDSRDYFSGNKYRGYNCFILNKSLFFLLCDFQFDVLFYLEKYLGKSLSTEYPARSLGYLGEILFGIFVYSIEKSDNYRVKSLQLVFFSGKSKTELRLDSLMQFLLRRMPIFYKFFNWLFPKGSKMRKNIIIAYKLFREGLKR